jgi:hypothetical protein
MCASSTRFCTHGKIGRAHDSSADSRASEAVARCHRRHAVGELDLPYRRHQLVCAAAIERSALDVYGGADVVSACRLRQVLVDQIAAAPALPQMMVRIDDRQGGFEDLFAVQGAPLRVVAMV